MVGDSLVAFPDIGILNPHFDLPFRWENGCIATVEQDSYNDVSNCVEVILRYRKGFRLIDNKSNFGIDAPEFEMAPIDINTIFDNIQDQEPRARVTVTEEVDSVDSLITKVRVETWDTLDSQ